MLDIKDFNFDNTQTYFDVKGFLFKLLRYWKWFILSVALCLFVAYQANLRKQRVYSVNSLVVVKNENSPFTPANTGVIFNWGGGASEKVNTIIAVLQSRQHNEEVVSYLEYYIDYLKENKYGFDDVYGMVPFKVNLDKDFPQLLNQNIGIKIISDSQFELSITSDAVSYSTCQYSTGEMFTHLEKVKNFKKVYQFDQLVDLPYLRFKLQKIDSVEDYINKQYYLAFRNFNATVSRYRGISVNFSYKGSNNLLSLEMQGTNKNRLVEYINTTIKVLKNSQLQEKNRFAANTIKFIDSTINRIQQENLKTTGEVKDYLNKKSIYNVVASGENILTQRLSQFDLEKDNVKRKIQYYNSLENYLNSNSDYKELPAPTVAGIDDANIVGNVSKLIELSVQRSKASFGIKNENTFKQYDTRMDALREVLLENINSARNSLQYDLNQINSKLSNLESDIRKLPTDQQDYLEIMRKFNLEQEILSAMMQKRNDAQILMASNTSDIQFIDEAKDVGAGLLASRAQINYILAVFLGLLIPAGILLVIFLLDTTVKNSDEIARLTKVPVLGIIPRRDASSKNYLVIENSKSAIAESFRNIRSSLQFVLRERKDNKAQLILISSSIGGEGKTFCAVNLASVFALAGKKTVLVGLDLRKPRIYGDFKIDRNVGVVNYLIGQMGCDEVIQSTGIDNLDIIPSGIVPPNPSELIMSDYMQQLIDELELKYDYVVFDTAPVGLVADALEIVNRCDVTLYMIRQNVSKKPTLALLNNKHKSGELKNVHIILNDFENDMRYGYGYKNGYGYYDEDRTGKNGIFQKIINTFKKV